MKKFLLVLLGLAGFLSSANLQAQDIPATSWNWPNWPHFTTYSFDLSSLLQKSKDLAGSSWQWAQEHPKITATILGCSLIFAYGKYHWSCPEAQRRPKRRLNNIKLYTAELKNKQKKYLKMPEFICPKNYNDYKDALKNNKDFISKKTDVTSNDIRDLLSIIKENTEALRKKRPLELVSDSFTISLNVNQPDNKRAVIICGISKEGLQQHMQISAEDRNLLEELNLLY